MRKRELRKMQERAQWEGGMGSHQKRIGKAGETRIIPLGNEGK